MECSLDPEFDVLKCSSKARNGKFDYILLRHYQCMQLYLCYMSQITDLGSMIIPLFSISARENSLELNRYLYSSKVL